MFKKILESTIGTANSRRIKSFRSTVARINALEPNYKKLSDDELKGQTALFKERIAQGETLDSILPEAFAVVREAAVRTLGLRPFDVQLIGGLVLHRGMIAEMKTGEGKTLVATLPAYLNSLTGEGVHIVTVNDYLARRDSEWMGQVYNFLNTSVGVVYSGMPEQAKKEAYKSDITYGQNNEFGFDYLRDNMKYSPESLMQRGHAYAIVDEVDSILIDEARTPLIISGPAEDSSELYYTVDKMVPFLQEGADYEIELRTKQPTLTEGGITHAEKLLKVDNLYDPKNIELIHHINQALKAHKAMERDVDYVVKDGQIIIVDDFTGRLMPGRRWSDGLHQAIEAKEKLHIEEETQTLATITFQNLFRMYKKLSGMTGTAVTEAAEFKEIYKLDVVVIPTNQPMIRDDQSDVVFRTRREKYQALAEDVIKVAKTGQPILVGTISIEQSETISNYLRQKGIPHNVLNAKQHEREAEIVAQAGRLNAITIATNMAGRGTDIMLGGNPKGLAIVAAGTKDVTDPAYIEAYEKYAEVCKLEKERVIAAGGLFIMGTERHESRRIDNQLRGRSGRQGDPGVSRFYVSLEDDLMKRFGGDKIKDMMKRLGWDEGIDIGGKMISKSIENAQKKVERFHFENRKHVTEYDDVLNKQRQVVYNMRNRVLFRDKIEDEVLTMIDDLLETNINAVCEMHQRPQNWDIEKLKETFQFLFNGSTDLDSTNLDPQEIFNQLRKEARQLYDVIKEKHQKVLDSLQETYTQDGEKSFLMTQGGLKEYDFQFTTFLQDTILERLDHYWNMHLQGMDNVRDTIGLRGYAQQNPLYEYQKEGFLLFSQMMDGMRQAIIRRIFYSEAALENLKNSFEAERARREAVAEQMNLSQETEEDSSGAMEFHDTAAGDPAAQRLRLEAQRKARRKMRKK